MPFALIAGSIRGSRDTVEEAARHGFQRVGVISFGGNILPEIEAVANAMVSGFCSVAECPRRSPTAAPWNIEVRINRRFKRQGRSWTRRGAEHLAQLLWLQAHPNDWKHWWTKTALAKTKINPGWSSSSRPPN